MKKITSYLIIIIILFNFIFCNRAYATDPIDEINNVGTSAIDSSMTSPADAQQYMSSGMTSDKGGNIINSASNEELGITTKEAIVSIVAIVLNCVPVAIQTLMMITLYDGEETKKPVTIEDMVMGKIDVLNLNFFDDSCNSKMIKEFRKSVCQWYYTLRLIAVAISLIVLIYIGLRMAISVTAPDKAKYKQMFTGWVESVLLLMVLHYIIAFFISMGEIFTDAVVQIKTSLAVSSFEDAIVNRIENFVIGSVGWESLGYTVFFWVLIFIQLKFVWAYARRLITIGFLILIAPLVCVCYAIDKVGDGKAQSFSNWMAELGANVFIQPIEAMIYLVFMGVASEIAKESSIVAMLFLISFTRVENIVLQIFNIRGNSLEIPKK